ncbi:MAG: hypothetical protein ACOH14_07655 [Rhodoglobus sp.]
MIPIVLLAELHAHGIDVEWQGGILTYVGDFDGLSFSLQDDLRNDQGALATFVSTGREGTLR